LTVNEHQVHNLSVTQWQE